MFIKEILEYDYNYAEYIVTDGKFNVICICMSVPLPLDKEPELGMKIRIIAPFSVDDIEVMLSNKKEPFIKKGKQPLEYFLAAEIVNKEKALVKIGGLLISLEDYCENGFSEGFEKGCFIEFKAPRLDCYIDI